MVPDPERSWGGNIARGLRGEITRAALARRYLPAVAVAIASGLCAAFALYPADLHYSFFTHTISDLGDWSKNPLGWWGFALAVWVLGVTFAPLYLYIHRRLSPDKRGMVRAGTLCSLVGCAGIFCLGIFDDVHLPLAGTLAWSDVHLFFVIVGFGGLGAGCYFHGHALPRNGALPTGAARTQIPPWMLMICLGVAAGISLVANAVVYHDAEWAGFGPTSISFWEWMILFGFIGYVFWMVLVLPAREVGPSAPQ